MKPPQCPACPNGGRYHGHACCRADHLPEVYLWRRRWMDLTHREIEQAPECPGATQGVPNE